MDKKFLIKQEFKLPDKTKEYLAIFFLIQNFRTIIVRKTLMQISKHMYDKIEELLIQNNNRLEQTKGYRYCKNVAINGLLSRFEFSCEKRGVQFVCTANVADFGQDDMIEFEYAAALSNLVENAVEATFRQDPTEERFVRVTINSEHGRMGTKIENTYSEAAIHMDETGVLTSEKKESGHGLGLHSVNSFVEKYNGIFSQDFGKDLAVTRLVFNMPDQA